MAKTQLNTKNWPTFRWNFIFFLSATRCNCEFFVAVTRKPSNDLPTVFNWPERGCSISKSGTDVCIEQPGARRFHKIAHQRLFLDVLAQLGLHLRHYGSRVLGAAVVWWPISRASLPNVRASYVRRTNKVSGNFKRWFTSEYHATNNFSLVVIIHILRFTSSSRGCL